ncbi:hypothetical protein [Synechococcus sp. WH 8101]|uniref:hypothetical protein n=1 Tax=Synechococcus sp. WH 8101 TaxID=59932 RepID=UPI001022E814|nr:hypothetical protein [Synechococcus sp. WH 8101]
MAEEKKKAGQDVNLIFVHSWTGLAQPEYSRIRHDRLIEADLKTKSYRIVNGANHGQAYHPQPGDLLANIYSGRISKFAESQGHFKPILIDQPRSKKVLIYEYQP